jgi:hypothetical protein
LTEIDIKVSERDLRRVSWSMKYREWYLEKLLSLCFDIGTI